MQTTVPSRGVVFARGLAVLTGWHGALLGTAVLYWLGLSDARPGSGCEGDGWGLNCAGSERENVAVLALFVGLPAIAGALLLGTAVAGGLAAARVRSAVLTGTVATLAGWLPAAAYVLSR